MPKLTKRFVDSLKPNHNGLDLFAWDSELRGFGVRMKPSGSASYLVQYRTAQGRTRRYAFAKVGTLTPDEARTKAKRLLVEVGSGNDPSAQRHQAREVLTVTDLCDRYLEAARAGLVMTRFRKPKRPSTIINDEGRVFRHIVPLIGKRVASDVTRAIVQHMADAIAAGKTAGTFKTKARGKAVVEGGGVTAARTVELLGGIWSWAEKRGLVSGPNPVRGVEKHRGAAKDRGARGPAARAGAIASGCHHRPSFDRFNWGASGRNLCASLARDRLALRLSTHRDDQNRPLYPPHRQGGAACAFDPSTWGE